MLQQMLWQNKFCFCILCSTIFPRIYGTNARVLAHFWSSLTNSASIFIHHLHPSELLITASCRNPSPVLFKVTCDVQTKITAPLNFSGTIVRQRWGIQHTNLTAKNECWAVKARHIPEPWEQNFQMCLICAVRGGRVDLCSLGCFANICYNWQMWEGVCCVMLFLVEPTDGGTGLHIRSLAMQKGACHVHARGLQNFLYYIWHAVSSLVWQASQGKESNSFTRL